MNFVGLLSSDDAKLLVRRSWTALCKLEAKFNLVNDDMDILGCTNLYRNTLATASRGLYENHAELCNVLVSRRILSRLEVNNECVKGHR